MNDCTQADVPPSAGSEPTDADLLRKLWRLNLKALIAELEGGESKAATLNVARQFLADQGVNRQTLDSLDGTRGSSLAALRDLPRFDDE